MSVFLFLLCKQTRGKQFAVLDKILFDVKINENRICILFVAYPLPWVADVLIIGFCQCALDLGYFFQMD